MPIKIKSKKKDFRRCGIAHPTESVEYSDDKFTKEELAVLKAEPMLIVEVVKKAAMTPAQKDFAEQVKKADETSAKAAAEIPAQEDLEAMTVAWLSEQIAKIAPDETLRGLRKDELIKLLKKLRKK